MRMENVAELTHPLIQLLHLIPILVLRNRDKRNCCSIISLRKSHMQMSLGHSFVIVTSSKLCISCTKAPWAEKITEQSLHVDC